MPIDNYNPVVSGLMQGFSLGHMIRRAAVEQEELERRKYRDQREVEIEDRNAQVDDIRNQILLQGAGRPVEAGMIEEHFPIPSSIPELPELGSTARVHRKPDPTRTVKYKTRDGRTIERELFTPEEQFDQQLKRAQLTEEMQLAVEGRRAKQAFEQRHAPVPGIGVPKVAIPMLNTQARIAATAEQGEKGRQTDVEIAKANRDAANARATESNAIKIRGQNIGAQGQARQLGQQQFANANQLRDDLTRATSTFNQVSQAYGQMQQSKSGDAVSDIALMYSYMKMLDPNSVVREGEYATAQNAGGVPALVQQQYNKLLGKGKLADLTRKDFIRRGESIYNQAKSDNAKTVEQYKGIAKRNNVPWEDVAIDRASTAEPSDLSKVSTEDLFKMLK